MPFKRLRLTPNPLESPGQAGGLVPSYSDATRRVRTHSCVLKKHVPQTIWHKNLGTGVNFVSGGPSAGDITSLLSPPSDSHSRGWLTSEEMVSSAERPDEDVQLGVQRPLRGHWDECPHQDECSGDLEDQLIILGFGHRE